MSLFSLLRSILGVIIVGILGISILATAAIAEDEELETRVEKLEKAMQDAKFTLGKKGGTLKISGRFAAGLFDGDDDSVEKLFPPEASFLAPEAKLRFDFKTPDEKFQATMRMNLNNASFNELDYFYVDILKPCERLPVNFRLGRFKFDYGEETWFNNPVEAPSLSNSAPNVAGNDEGLALFGEVGENVPVKYYVALMNGNTGSGADNNTTKALAFKLGATPIPPLYLSGSFFRTGKLGTQDSEMGIAGLKSPPTGTTAWDRQFWEVDARYDFQKGKTMWPPAYTDSKVYVLAGIGGFSDDITGLDTAGNPLPDRDGTYYQVGVGANLLPRLHCSVRTSRVDLDDDSVAKLNGIEGANNYTRTSLGVLYRFNSQTNLKFEYNFNDADAPGKTIGDINSWGAALALVF